MIHEMLINNFEFQLSQQQKKEDSSDEENIVLVIDTFIKNMEQNMKKKILDENLKNDQIKYTLWMILDEIDTLDDMLKPMAHTSDKLKIKSLNNFRKIVLKLANKRHEIISSTNIEDIQASLDPLTMENITNFISE